MESTAIQLAISQYGYWALFAGTFLEGETFFLLGGIAARQGLLDPWWVGICAGLGGFVGDQLFFILGLTRGEAMLKRFKPLARRSRLARRVVRRHAVPLILLSRFLYGFRMIVPLSCGAAKVHWARFLLLNLVSAVLWTLAFGGLGFLFGGWVSRHLGMMRDLQIIVGLVIAVLLISLAVGRLVRRRLMNLNGD